MTDANQVPVYDDEDFDDIDDLLGASIPSVKFPEIGASVVGTILSMKSGVQTDIDGEIRTFKDGTPRRQVILTLDTSEKVDADDDGRRRLFVQGTMIAPFRAAIKAAGVSGPRPGGDITVKYVRDDKPTSKGMNPPKVYEVSYTKPF